MFHGKIGIKPIKTILKLNLDESLLTTIADRIPLEISSVYLSHREKLESARPGLLLSQEKQSTT